MQEVTMDRTVVGNFAAVAVLFGLAGTAVGQVVLRPAQPTATNVNVPVAVKNSDLATATRFAALESRVKALEATVAAQAATLDSQGKFNNQINNRTKAAESQLTTVNSGIQKMKFTYNNHKHNFDAVGKIGLYSLYADGKGQIRVKNSNGANPTEELMFWTNFSGASLPLTTME